MRLAQPCAAQVWPPSLELYPSLAAKTLEVIRAADAEAWCAAQSFCARYLEELHALGATMELTLLAFPWRAPQGLTSIERPRLVPLSRPVPSRPVPSRPVPTVASAARRAPNVEVPFYVSGISCFHARCTRSAVAHAHKRGLRVNAWTVDSETAMSRCLCNGVDGLITNEVTRCAAVIGRFDDAGVWDVASWLLDLLLRLASLFLPDPRVSYAIQVQAPPAATGAGR